MSLPDMLVYLLIIWGVLGKEHKHTNHAFSVFHV